MHNRMRKAVMAVLTVSLVIGSAGCSKDKKEPKPTPKTTAKVDEGNANASGEGEGQADVPLVIACKKFSKNFNPFSAVSEADRQAVDLTQIKLVTNDRAGKLIYKGIDGELRQYGDENYTYYGATDLSIDYDEKSDRTRYQIKLRDDLVFSNGEKLTIDDVIFSMYVFCDNDYRGEVGLKTMPIQGLLNYQADSNKADKISKKRVSRFIKKNPKKLRTYIQKNITKQGITGTEAKRLVERQARILLAKNTGKRVKNISGIKKVSDYEMTITTIGYSKEMAGELQIPICALHYYGDASKYNVEKNRFGFRRGDISAILANKTAPLGAGAYRFVKLEDDVVYFTSNELYYLGCPQIAYLQLKDMTEILERTRHQLQEKTESEAASTEEPESLAITPLAESTELTEGVVDVISGNFTDQELKQIMLINSNKELSGNTIDARLISNGKYHYIGIDGTNVSVGNDAGSDASKNLRKAIATLFAASRGVLKENYGDLVRIVNYPVAAESWVSPSVNEDNYVEAYSLDCNGEEIFEDEEETAVRLERAAESALGYLEKAGYRMEDGKAVEAPSGAALRYKVWIENGDKNPLYPVIENARQALENMGITLVIQSVNGEERFQKKLNSGTQQIWVGSRNIQDMDLEGRYGISKDRNRFGVCDKKLGRSIAKLQKKLSAEERKKVYRKCFDGILEQAVEVPVCEFRSVTLFSAKRIEEDTIPKDISPYYTWLNEIQKVEME